MLYGILNSNPERTTPNSGIDGNYASISDNDIIMEFVAPIQILSNQPSFSSDTLSLKRFSFQQPVQRWEIETNVAPNNEGHEFLSHSVYHGHTVQFNIRMPQLYKAVDPSSSFISIPTGNGRAIGQTQITVSGLLEGEFIRFEGHAKVYLVTEGSTNRTNTGTATFRPALVSAVAEGARVYRGGNVIMRAIYDDSVQLGIKYVDGILADPGTIRLIEAL